MYINQLNDLINNLQNIYGYKKHEQTNGYKKGVLPRI